MNHGFMKIATAVPKINVADIPGNKQEIIKQIQNAQLHKIEVLVFPALVLSGSTCGDLFGYKTLSDQCAEALHDIALKTEDCNVLSIIGTPLWYQSECISGAVIIKGGQLLTVCANNLPDSVIELGDTTLPLLSDNAFLYDGISFGITFDTEDVPNCDVSIILENKPCTYKAYGKLKSHLSAISSLLENAVVYCSNGAGESTSSAVYSGSALVYENSCLLCEASRYMLESTLTVTDINTDIIKRNRDFYDMLDLGYSSQTDFSLHRKLDMSPFAVQSDEEYEELLEIQATALCRRLQHIHCDKIIIGISGGLDSTMVLVSAVRAMEKLGYPSSNIIGVTMPGFGTTKRTNDNAKTLIQGFGASIMEIDITKVCEMHFADIGHNKSVTDIVFENAQARERTQILLDLANKHHALMVGTGDLSEIALGWTTFGGDALAQYSINATLPKTLMRAVLAYVARTTSSDTIREAITDVLDTPVSPELLPADEKGNIQQKTEERVGPYELHDFFIYYFVKYKMDKQKILFMVQNAFDGIYDSTVIEKWLNTFIDRFFASQFKRFGMCEGPMVTDINLSPAGGFSIPGDAKGHIFK